MMQLRTLNGAPLSSLCFGTMQFGGPRREALKCGARVRGLLVTHNRLAAVTPGHTQVTHTLTIEVKRSLDKSTINSV
jgi:hypothetical protein